MNCTGLLLPASRLLTLALVATSLIASVAAQSPSSVSSTALRSEALTLADSLAAFKLDPEFEIRCIAAEPLVVDPVEVVYDEAGRIWVVEMRDYPFIRDGSLPRGRIKILHPDGRGGYTASTFVDGLEMPTGIALWRGGAVVTLAGRVVYFPDDNRDFIADGGQVWITGLSTGNEQLRANHPTLHSDGWWYVASGLRGGTLKPGPNFSAAFGHPPVELSTRDFRFQLAAGKIESITGPSQFGLSHDSFGDRFLVSNRNPARKVQYEQSELVGNPLAGMADSVVDVLPAGAESKVIPAVDAWTTSNLHAGQYTAACAVTVVTSPGAFDADGLGAFEESIFVCEPTGSLVTRDKLERSASDGRLKWRLSSSPKDKTREWLASRDPWFRPVNVTITPSGGVLVADMHRAVIEHPQWVPEELVNRPDEQFGSNAGRLYEIRHKDDRSEKNTLKHLSSDEELVRSLASSNTWLRKTAVRIILERFSAGELAPEIRAAVLFALQQNDDALSVATTTDLINLYVVTTNHPEEAVEQLVASQTAVDSARPARVAHLLHVVAKLGLTSPALNELIGRHLQSPQTSVRLSAYQAASSRLGADEASYSLSLLESDLALERAIVDPDEMILLAGALRTQPGKLALAVLKVLGRKSHSLSYDPSWIARVVAKLATASRSVDKAVVARLHEAAEGLITSDQAAKQMIGIGVLLSLKKGGGDSEVSTAASKKLTAIATSATQSQELRAQAIELLSLLAGAGGDLFRELTSDPQWQVSAAAWKAWGRFDYQEFPTALANALTNADLRTRPTLIRLIGNSPAGCDALIGLLETESIDSRSLGSNTLRQLADAHTGSRAEQLKSYLREITNSDRARVVVSFRDCLTLSADPVRGKQHFVKHCASCHQIDGIGQNIGPDISDSRTKSPEGLLTAILDPNRAVDNNYFRYNILTVEGGSYEGIIVGEDAERVVLRTIDNRRIEILRSEIELKKLSGQSLMPEGFENQLTQQELADLISFIKNWRYLDGSAPATLR